MEILIYLLFIASFLSVVKVIKKGPRIGLYAVILTYLAIGGWASFLLISEALNPSIDANIGLGISLLLMLMMSIAGFIPAIIASYITNRKRT